MSGQPSPGIRRHFPVLIVLCGLLLAAAGRGVGVRNPEIVPRFGGMLRVRTFSEPSKPNLDPAAGIWVFVTEQIYDGLVRLDAKLRPMPSLAYYWTISKDGLTCVFYLQEKVLFHDGTELTSEDVKFSFERLILPKTGSPFRDYLIAKVAGAREFVEGRAKDVSGFRALDKYRFEIQWLRADASALFLLSISFCKILPRESLLAKRNFFYKPIGTGAFKFDSWILGPKGDIGGVRLVRNSSYFGNRPYLDAIEFSPNYTVDDFMNREIDVIPYLSDRLALEKGQVVEGGPWTISYLFMSCHIPPLDRSWVREALAFAINKEKLAEAARHIAYIRRTTNNFIPPRWEGFYPQDEVETFHRSEARRILEEQGYFFDKPFPKLLLFVPASKTESNARFGDELQDQLSKIEIPLEVKTYRSLQEVKDVRRPFLIKIDWALDYPDPENIILPLFASQARISLDVHRYSNAKVDGLLDDIGLEPSLSRRTALFNKIEEILGRDRPAVPLFTNDPLLVLQLYVRGVKISPLGFNYLEARTVWLDKKELPQ